MIFTPFRAALKTLITYAVDGSIDYSDWGRWLDLNDALHLHTFKIAIFPVL